jgi:hypothetical protein
MQENESQSLKINRLEIMMEQNNKDHDTLKEMLCRIDKKIDGISEEYVKKDEFNPVKNIVYGMVGFVLLAFIGALISLVFIK